MKIQSSSKTSPLPCHPLFRSGLKVFRKAVENALVNAVNQAGSTDVMLQRCVLYHFIDDNDSEFISRILADGTVAVDTLNETYFLKFEVVALDLLIDILEELEAKRFYPIDSGDLPLPSGISLSLH